MKTKNVKRLYYSSTIENNKDNHINEVYLLTLIKIYISKLSLG